MQIEGVRKILFFGFLWGLFCFLLGYGLNGHIWEILTAIYHGLGGG